ncbi:MAG TPA: dTMP kinase [Candidatus Kapabacteria bacterium]|nr:dTMP kinase [Candidatus Kapabacteria bacterium]HOV91893.1 dTMP kinase [Candidatus Kapabacteria bacterium]
MFITFEGIDGSGKSTQVKLLEEYFASLHIKYISVREPGGTDFSEEIRDILLNSSHSINSVSELMLFEAARADLVRKIIKPSIDKNIIVIADRFYDSTTAYQGYGRQLNIDYINICNKLAVGNCIPDITFLLTLPLNEARQRTIHLKQDRIETSSIDFFERVYNGFLEIAKANKDRIQIIDATQSIDAIFNSIIAILKNKFNYIS